MGSRPEGDIQVALPREETQSAAVLGFCPSLCSSLLRRKTKTGYDFKGSHRTQQRDSENISCRAYFLPVTVVVTTISQEERFVFPFYH